MLKVAICDDDKHYCRYLEELLLKYSIFKDEKISSKLFFTGEDLIEKLRSSSKYDLIFLDIELGSTTGVNIGSKIRKELDDYITKIIFISAQKGYEPQLFDVQPLNFLNKPIDVNKFNECIDLAVKLLNPHNEVFKYKVKREFFQVNYYKIIYFSSSLRKMKIITLDGSDEFYATMSSLEGRLPEQFVRIHVSYIVNFYYIKRLGTKTILLTNGDEIPVGKNSLETIYKLQLKLSKE